MFRSTCGALMLLLGSLAAIPGKTAEPSFPFKPLKLSAEFEVYSGGITGKDIGASFHSVTTGDYGVRFTFGFLKALNFSLGYLYSTQARTFTAVSPSIGPLPSGTVLLRTANLNVAFGNGEINLLQLPRAVFYLSPGVGFARNGARSLTLITPLGSATAPIFPGTAVSVNLGTGVKIYPLKHIGFRLDARDFVSGGGTGSLNSSLPSPVPLGLACPVTNPTCNVINVGQFFGKIPVQNNLVFTLGLIFKIF